MGNKMGKPLLSVCMSNYNYSRFIGEALEAILTQSYPPDELVIVDDCSTDSSVEIIESYIKKHPNVRLIRNEKNMGVTYTVKRSLMEAKYDYIHSTASDDIVLPGFYEESMKMLLKYPEAGLCCSDTVAVILDEKMKDNHRRFIRLNLGSEPTYFTPPETLCLMRRRAYTPVMGNTAIFKRSAISDAGWYPPELKWSHDAFPQEVIIFRYGFCYIPKVMSMQRTHSKQYSKGITPGKEEREVIRRTLQLVTSGKYDDVLPAFKQTASFSCFPWEVLMVVLKEEKYRDFLTFKLVKFALIDKFIKRTIKLILPRAAVSFLVNASQRLKGRK